MIRFVLCLVLFLGASPAWADGGRRIVCRPNHAAPVVVQPVAAQAVIAQPVAVAQALAPYALPPAQPIVIQNNYNGSPALLGSTIYGYAADPTGAQALRNPFNADPAAVLREAARLADQSQQLARETVNAYSALGTLAITTGGQADQLRAQTEQLRAQAALIDATRPAELRTATFAAPAAAAPTAVQRVVSGGQTICITPDGNGGFSIHVEPAAGSVTTADVVQPNAPPADAVPPAIRVMQERCASCHTGPDSKAGFQLFDANGYVGLTDEQAAKVLEVTESGRMPLQPAPELTAAEFAALTLFLTPQR